MLVGFSIINHPFWGTTIFGNTLMVSRKFLESILYTSSTLEVSKIPRIFTVFREILKNGAEIMPKGVTVGSFFPLFTRFFSSQVVQKFFHQQYYEIPLISNTSTMRSGWIDIYIYMYTCISTWDSHVNRIRRFSYYPKPFKKGNPARGNIPNEMPSRIPNNVNLNPKIHRLRATRLPTPLRIVQVNMFSRHVHHFFRGLP